MFARRGLRNLLLSAAFAAGLAASVLLARQLGERREAAVQQAQLAQQLQLHARGLEQLVDRYRALPQLLALDPELRDALQETPGDPKRQRINLRLEAASRTTRASTLTLIDRSGIAIAASNWRVPSSNVGQRYSFRPYVQQALARGHGRFYGIGITTGMPGYFLSEAVRGDDGQPIGVVVIKIDLAALEREWLDVPDIVLVSDEYGVTFLASRAQWRYRMLRPLDADARATIAETRKYAGQRLLPYRTRPAGAAADAALVRIEEPVMPGAWMQQSLRLPGTGWTLHLLHDARGIAAAGRRTAIATALGWLVLAMLALLVRQRLHTAALRRRTRSDMERLVEQHAREMRTARDALLEAAQGADTGLSRQLEHLPQGVVVVDARQRLVAWNTRYAELFRFPAELLQVGRPIADLFRFNAQRGLLGPGPVEEAIERRLRHLRSGSPHHRESEKDDGTVLEIRGNPLPDGGFVTSYNDITSYKKTARELRSLADALEHRIAERTRDLEQARREAEQANHHKSRFVASAVHDLLQPLNAARMFVAELRGLQASAESRRLVARVDQALAAQDGILATLLDISRLESGTLRTEVRDFALEPLLEELGHEFGVLAEARGLSLRRVPTRSVVRSDAALLRRIVQNLLSNAVRYTPRGRLLLGCRREGDAVRIEVHDQGPGIPDAQREAIFEEFRRLDHGGDGDRGAGLGLAIVQRIGRLLGHQVGLRSRVGRGSVFSVTVPRGAVAGAAAAAPQRPANEAGLPLSGTRVWCVDDDPRTCGDAEALLRRWGCTVAFAGGSDAAIGAARDGEAPDIVLLDPSPDGSGGTTLHSRLCRAWNASPPVVLATAARDPALRQQANAQGWGLLYKPVRAPALRALMTQLLLRAVSKPVG